MSQFGARIGEIHDLGAEVVGIAVTPTFAQMAFARTLGIDFPLLSDWEGATAEAYGVRYEVWKGHVGVAQRSVFIIDRDGVIGYVWSSPDAHETPDVDVVIAALAEIAE